MFALYYVVSLNLNRVEIHDTQDEDSVQDYITMYEELDYELLRQAKN
jgi:hypothetical protein